MTKRVRSRRGRPKGSELDDRKLLSRIAGLLVQGKAGNVAAAVRQIAGHDPSLIRRLQRKFRRDRKALLAEARRTVERLALERQFWLDEIQRVTKPLDWHRENDPVLRAMAALNLEQQERLAKTFSKSSG
jgi:hypothetical protein